MSLAVVVVLVAALVFAGAAIYVAIRWTRRRNKQLNNAPADATRADAVSAPVTSIPGTLDPKTVGKLRAGREEGRLSEDDIARQKMGARGRPGEPPPAYDLRESETQIPKHVDPGHTA